MSIVPFAVVSQVTLLFFSENQNEKGVCPSVVRESSFSGFSEEAFSSTVDGEKRIEV